MPGKELELHSVGIGEPQIKQGYNMVTSFFSLNIKIKMES